MKPATLSCYFITVLLLSSQYVLEDGFEDGRLLLSYFLLWLGNWHAESALPYCTFPIFILAISSRGRTRPICLKIWLTCRIYKDHCRQWEEIAYNLFLFYFCVFVLIMQFLYKKKKPLTKKTKGRTYMLHRSTGRPYFSWFRSSGAA